MNPLVVQLETVANLRSELRRAGVARDNFPIFFRRGKMPMGAYKVEGPQAQARKKNECLGCLLLGWQGMKGCKLSDGK